ncbi:hypothetical protein CHCC20442_0123 [Bacillus licheniformis]|nr:hypothetical protein CHCC20442_0123 [Bacillus licheniformis]TWK59805.1 hypothetical protein CHCC20342_0736 [Bacillus licheniformis]
MTAALFGRGRPRAISAVPYCFRKLRMTKEACGHWEKGADIRSLFAAFMHGSPAD